MIPSTIFSAFSFNEQTFDYIFLGNELDTDEELYLSFEANRTKIPGIFPTWVYGQDIVKFTNGAANYDGYEYEMFFDGSDVGLTTMSEKVDGISVWPPEYYEVLAADVDFPYDCNAGVIFLSTRGRYRVQQQSGRLPGRRRQRRAGLLRHQSGVQHGRLLVPRLRRLRSQHRPAQRPHRSGRDRRRLLRNYQQCRQRHDRQRHHLPVHTAA